MAKQIDTVTVEVVRNLLMSIAEETYGIIVRSAYSTNMKERRDVCTAVIDPDGNSVAQVESLAALLGSMLSVVPNIYEKFGKDEFSESYIDSATVQLNSIIDSKEYIYRPVLREMKTLLSELREIKSVY